MSSLLGYAAFSAPVPGCAQCASSDWAQNAPTIMQSAPDDSPIDLGDRNEGPMTHAPESALLGASG